MTEWFHYFKRVLFSQNFASRKFHKNKTLLKISEFIVANIIITSVFQKFW